jgi:adenylate cyclase
MPAHPIVTTPVVSFAPVVLGNMDYERGISDSLALAQHAIDLDPEDPWAHLAAGYVFTFSRRFGPQLKS